jgi:hypothetical protein
MDSYIIGFLVIVSFTVLIGAGALITISFEGKRPASKAPVTGHLFASVRRLNTDTIETIDPSGQAQQWTRAR